jgi:GntR family transcriptional repressor for pyruvate dehydrogenase complex
MQNIKKITRDGVSDQVFHQLKDNVVKGIWRPGDRIPSENQLVSLFGVSRASIRMAIQRMVTLGLLESRVGNGTFVKEFDPGALINELFSISIRRPEDQIEIMEFRKALETEALRLACRRATEEELGELTNIHHRARAAIKKKDLETYFKEDMQFHIQIFKMSKNSIFTATIHTMEDILFSHFYTIAKDFFQSHEIPSDEADSHTVILNALKKNDPQTCITAYTKLTEDLISMYRQIQNRSRCLEDVLRPGCDSEERRN